MIDRIGVAKGQSEPALGALEPWRAIRIIRRQNAGPSATSRS